MAMADKDNSKSNSDSSDSSKKVAKAAKAGATPSSSASSDTRSYGFQMALAGIIIAGSALVFFAWNTRDAAALQPSFDDHWHLPYGIYDCRIDDFQDPFFDPQIPNSGIHTHSDGVVHLHPFSSTATGNNATLEVFLEAVDADLEDDTALVFRNRPEIAEAGVQCDNQDAVLQILRFTPGGDEPVEVITEDLTSYRFRTDQEPWVIALAPLGADVPPPPADAIQSALDSSPGILRTDGLGDLGSLDGLGAQGDGALGFDDDGNLIGPDGAPILGDDGEPFNRNDLQITEVEDDG